MAKKRRLRAKNRMGVVVPFDVAAQDVTMNNSNDLETEINRLKNNGGTSELIKNKIEEVYARLKAVYAALGNIAFWEGKPDASLLLPDLDWGNVKHTLRITNNIPNVVVSKDGTPVTGDILVEEGATVNLLVSPTGSISLTSVSASTGTVTDNNNGTFTITLTMGQTDILLTITGTTSQAFEISYGTMVHCTVETAPVSILGGATATIVFDVDEGYDLVQSGISVDNASIVSYDKSTGTLVIGNATDDVEISATAEIPKLKFLKGYRLTGYDTISNSEWLKDGADISARASVSQMMKVPMQEVSVLPAVDTYWGIAMANGESLPYAIAFYNITNEGFDPIGHYVFKPGSTYKQDLVGNSMSYADEKSKDDILNALVAGTLGVRVTICIDETGTALMHGISYGVKIGTWVFQPGTPANNYEFTTDAADFLDQVFEF